MTDKKNKAAFFGSFQKALRDDKFVLISKNKEGKGEKIIINALLQIETADLKRRRKFN